MKKIFRSKKNFLTLFSNIKYNVDIIKNKGFYIPCLAVILVRNRLASDLYVKNKIKACKGVGFLSFRF